MNRANVDAITRVLWEINRMSDDWGNDADVADLARRLAEAGLLDPRALTVEQVSVLFDVPDNQKFTDLRIDELVRLAQGKVR